MICPLCKKAKTTVISTRELSDELTMRVRLCNDYTCNYQFSTYEEIDKESGKIRKIKHHEST